MVRRVKTSAFRKTENREPNVNVNGNANVNDNANRNVNGNAAANHHHHHSSNLHLTSDEARAQVVCSSGDAGAGSKKYAFSAF